MMLDPRVDQYIAQAPEFARPVLTEVRRRVRQACPAAEETIKWNVPFFVLSGQLLASMAAFKKHVKAGVWGDGKPAFVDVVSVASLPSVRDFAEQLQSAVRRIEGAGSAAPKQTQSVPKKTPAKARKKLPPKANKKALTKSPTQARKKARPKVLENPHTRARSKR